MLNYDQHAEPIANMIQMKGSAAIKNASGDRVDALDILKLDRDLTEIDFSYVTSTFNRLC